MSCAETRGFGNRLVVWQALERVSCTRMLAGVHWRQRSIIMACPALYVRLLTRSNHPASNEVRQRRHLMGVRLHSCIEESLLSAAIQENCQKHAHLHRSLRRIYQAQTHNEDGLSTTLSINYWDSVEDRPQLKHKGPGFDPWSDKNRLRNHIMHASRFAILPPVQTLQTVTTSHVPFGIDPSSGLPFDAHPDDFDLDSLEEPYYHSTEVVNEVENVAGLTCYDVLRSAANVYVSVPIRSLLSLKPLYRDHPPVCTLLVCYQVHQLMLCLRWLAVVCRKELTARSQLM